MYQWNDWRNIFAQQLSTLTFSNHIYYLYGGYLLKLAFFNWTQNRLESLVVESSLRVREVKGSIPDRGGVIPKTLKMLPVVYLFSTQH